MKKFLYWNEVQQRLNMHAEQTGTCYSFYDGVKELWEDGMFHEAQELPVVSFLEWNVDDLDELERLLDSTPVDLRHFSHHFRSDMNARSVVKYALKLESSPIRIARNQAMGLHTLNAFELLYVVRGQAQLILESKAEPLLENTLAILSPQLLHDVAVASDCLLLSIALTEQTTEETLYKMLRQENVLSEFFHSGFGGNDSSYLIFTPESPRQILSIFRGILHECYTRSDYSKVIYDNYLEILFALLLRQRADYESHQSSRQQQGAGQMLNVLKHLQDNYRTISLQQLAELFHYEPSYLGKQIKASTGKNYTELIRELRISETKRLLQSTDLSMDEIAEQAGYDSRVHFFRSFRAAVGVTPGQYRKRNPEKQTDNDS